jgi:hypothetical protein
MSEIRAIVHDVINRILQMCVGKNLKHFDELLVIPDISFHIVRKGKPTITFIVDENNTIVETRYELAQ